MTDALAQFQAQPETERHATELATQAVATALVRLQIALRLSGSKPDAEMALHMLGRFERIGEQLKNEAAERFNVYRLGDARQGSTNREMDASRRALFAAGEILADGARRAEGAMASRPPMP